MQDVHVYCFVNDQHVAEGARLKVDTDKHCYHVHLPNPRLELSNLLLEEAPKSEQPVQPVDILILGLGQGQRKEPKYPVKLKKDEFYSSGERCETQRTMLNLFDPNIVDVKVIIIAGNVEERDAFKEQIENFQIYSNSKIIEVEAEEMPLYQSLSSYQSDFSSYKHGLGALLDRKTSHVLFSQEDRPLQKAFRDVISQPEDHHKNKPGLSSGKVALRHPISHLADHHKNKPGLSSGKVAFLMMSMLGLLCAAGYTHFHPPSLLPQSAPIVLLAIGVALFVMLSVNLCRLNSGLPDLQTPLSHENRTRSNSPRSGYSARVNLMKPGHDPRVDWVTVSAGLPENSRLRFSAGGA